MDNDATAVVEEEGKAVGTPEKGEAEDKAGDTKIEDKDNKGFLGHYDAAEETGDKKKVEGKGKTETKGKTEATDTKGKAGSEEVDKGKGEEKKDLHHQKTGEEIQNLRTRAKLAESRNKDLEQENADFKSGKVKPSEEKEEAKAGPQEPDYKFIREELEDVSHTEEYITRELDDKRRAYNLEVKDYNRDIKEAEDKAEALKEQNLQNFKDVVKEYADYFEDADPENPDADPVFKNKEMEAEIDTLTDLLGVVVGVDEKGKPVKDTPLRNGKVVLEMMMYYVTRQDRANKTAKAKSEETSRVLSNRSSTPKSGHSSDTPKSKGFLGHYDDTA